MKIKKLYILFFLFTLVAYSQKNINLYVSEYGRLVSKDLDSVIIFSEKLISTKDSELKAFGYACKAKVYSLKLKFNEADLFFEKALEELNKTTSKSKTETKANIFYLKSARYLESQELIKSVSLLNEAIDLCASNCSFIFELKLQSALGRAYSMSKKHIKALEINKRSLDKIKKALLNSTNKELKKEYVRELVKASNRTMNLYLSGKKKYKPYLDSTQKYIAKAEEYSKKYNVPNYKSYILSSNGDINFYQEKYFKAKEFYKKSIAIHIEKKHSKKEEQGLFKIAECDYYLGNYDAAEAIFLRQVDTDIWNEFQLLENGAKCYFYLFKINEQKEYATKASNYAVTYGEKIKRYYETKNENDLSINDILHYKEREKEIESYIEKHQLQKRQKRVYFVLILILVLGLFVTYYFYNKKKNRENISKLNLRIQELQQDIYKQNKVPKSSSLSSEEALKLIKKLKTLEREELFLQSNYTLSMVAKRLQTNSSYLSKTVNEYLNLSFSEYSNKLKINSIVNKLKEHKSFRNYTIDALAQEAGYKSVNSFNTNFKKILKVTPSQYLKQLKEEN